MQKIDTRECEKALDMVLSSDADMQQTGLELVVIHCGMGSMAEYVRAGVQNDTNARIEMTDLIDDEDTAQLFSVWVGDKNIMVVLVDQGTPSSVVEVEPVKDRIRVWMEFFGAKIPRTFTKGGMKWASF